MTPEQQRKVEAIRDRLKEAITKEGVGAYVLIFSDPDSDAWTWSAGSNDIFSIGATTVVLEDLKKSQINY